MNKGRIICAAENALRKRKIISKPTNEIAIFSFFDEKNDFGFVGQKRITNSQILT